MPDQAHLPPGTLDLLILRAVSLGPTKSGASDANRRAKFYELTAAERKPLQDETESCNRQAAVITSALSAQPEEL